MMKTNSVLAATIATLLASQTAAAIPRSPVKASASIGASKKANVGATAKRAKRQSKLGANKIKAPQTAAQAPESTPQPSTMVGGAKGAALVAAAVAAGVSPGAFGARWQVYRMSDREISVFETHDMKSKTGERATSSFVFERAWFSKTFKLTEAQGPKSWSNVPDTDPALHLEGKFSPGPDSRFRAIPHRAGEDLDATYARALGEAKRSGTPVVAVLNSKIMTVYATSPATRAAYEAEVVTPVLGTDL